MKNCKPAKPCCVQVFALKRAKIQSEKGVAIGCQILEGVAFGCQKVSKKVEICTGSDIYQHVMHRLSTELSTEIGGLYPVGLQPIATPFSIVSLEFLRTAWSFDELSLEFLRTEPAN
ncbi:hypothetical protein [Mitsuokella sp. WILCCON 0060]|uniref:hypothetical protein n=1 Tax=Mitsuokella sp. WILCCON 0060 TaxID=3345341 RepID=UPI003F1BA65F